MESAHTTFNDNLHPSEVDHVLLQAVHRTHYRLRADLDPMALLAEIRAGVAALAGGEGMPNADYARRACAVLGTALADGVGTSLNEAEADEYYQDRLDDLHATVSSMVPLLAELGRENVAASMRRLLGGVSRVSIEDVEGGEYLNDLFLATADAIALAVTDGR